MAANIQIVKTEDFVRAQPDGTLDRAASLELLKSIVGTLGSTEYRHVLLDTRHAQVNVSVLDMFDIASALAADPLLRKLSVALLARENDADADFFETVSRNRGADVRAFTDFESAINWLILRPTD